MLRSASITVLALVLLAIACVPAMAAAKPAARPTAKPVVKPATKASKTSAVPTKVARSGKQPPPVVAAIADDELALVPEQLAIAERVMVGVVACEFDQRIEIAAVAARPGHFVLRSGSAHYALVPYETTTGAVRLEDRKQGVVWLQIPSKSMLLSARLGQRLVDNCLHEDQRSAVVASADGLGIAEPVPLLVDAPISASADMADASTAAQDAPDIGNWPWTLAVLWPAMPSAASITGWLDIWTPPFDIVAWAPVGPAPAPALAASADAPVRELSAAAPADHPAGN